MDTNTLISGILISSSVPDRALKKASDRGILLFPDATLEELQKVIMRPKFDKYVSIAIRVEFIARIVEKSEHIEIIKFITACRDSEDDKFLEVALNGNANFILTEDQDLLVLHPFNGISIISPTQFLEL